MTYNTTQNNRNDNTISMNTRGYQFMNRDGFDPSTLSFGYWNEMISIRLNPALEPSKQTENRLFDYEKTVSTSLNLEKAMALFSKVTSDVLPAIKNDENKSVAVQVAGDTLIVIGTSNTMREDKARTQFLGIHKSINPDTKIPEISIFYEFKNIPIIEDYDEKTGKYKTSEKQYQPSEFELFMILMKSAIMALGNATVHADRNVNKYSTAKTNNIINGIAEKTGVETGGFYSNGNGYSRKQSVSFSSSNAESHTETTQNVTDIDNIEDINSFLN